MTPEIPSEPSYDKKTKEPAFNLKPTEFRLPAEWEPQDAVILAIPHKNTDWSPILEEAVRCITEIAAKISLFEKVIILNNPDDYINITSILHEFHAFSERIIEIKIPVNDTWTRDYGQITVKSEHSLLMVKFGFNGWGLKFPSFFDNLAAAKLHSTGIFNAPLKHSGLILEGGSIESNGTGTIFTTSRCLLSPNRNPHLSKSDIEETLGCMLGARHFLWLNHGYLAGDDTDSHIDTLARIAPDDTILYVSCSDQSDEHFLELDKMREEVESFRTEDGNPFNLLPLPMPAPFFDDEGNRLPATYANYLVINGAVLVPTYNDPADEDALSVIAKAYSGRKIIGIDCRTLIKQHGSLHCVTMQLPAGSLK